jgi:hypothetical protein
MRQESGPQARTPSRLAGLLLQPAGQLREADRNALEDDLHANPALARGYPLKTRVHPRVAEHEPAAREPWLQEAETPGLPPFRTGARSLRRDDAASVAARTTPWSPGQCAGQICRVTRLKRRGYGRAKLDWLRQRSLHRHVVPMTLDVRRRQVQQQIAASRIPARSHTWRALAEAYAPTGHASSKGRENPNYIGAHIIEEQLAEVPPARQWHTDAREHARCL